MAYQPPPPPGGERWRWFWEKVVGITTWPAPPSPGEPSFIYIPTPGVPPSAWPSIEIKTWQQYLQEFVGLIFLFPPLFSERLIPWTAAAIIGFLTGLWGKVLIGMAGMTGMSLFHTFTSRSRKEAVAWATEAVDQFFVSVDEWAPFVSKLMDQMTGSKGELKASDFTSLPVGAGHAAGALAKGYLNDMLGLIMPGAMKENFPLGLTPEEGMAGAERFLGVNLQFQMSAWLLHLLGDTFSFGMWKAMKDLPNALSWSFGIGWLSWLVMGTPFRMGIAEPLEIFFNRMYRPYKFNVSQVAKMFWKQDKDNTWFVEHMKDLGVKDPDMSILLEQERNKLGDGQMYDFYRTRHPSHDYLVNHFKTQGHSPSDALVLAVEMERREVKDLVTNIAKTAQKHYKDRRMSEAELTSFLREANWTDEEANLIIQDLRMQMALEKPEEVAERVLTPANIARLFQLGKRTRQWAEAKLTQRGFLVEEIPDFLSLYLPKEEKKPEPKEPPASLVGTLYKKGLISKAEAKDRWADLDLGADYIALLVMLYAPPIPAPPPPPRAFSPSEIGRLYQGQYVTRDLALSRLTTHPINFTPDDAVLFLDSFYTPPETTEAPPKEVPISVAGSLYKEGKITLTDLEAYLDTFNYSPTSKEFLLLEYQPPIPAPPPLPREFTPTETGRLFNIVAITPRDALDRLTGPQVNMTKEDAIIYLRSFYIPLGILDIGTQYTVGTMSKVEAIRQLMTSLPGLLESDTSFYLDTFF